MINRIVADQILSFSEGSVDYFELKNLNVLIGVNGSGKSNFLEIFGLLRSCPRSLVDYLRQSGRWVDFIWKGESRFHPWVGLELTHPVSNIPIRYEILFERGGEKLVIDTEGIFQFPHGTTTQEGLNEIEAIIQVFPSDDTMRIGQRGRRLGKDYDAQQSIMSQLKDPEHYPELSYISGILDNIRLYRNWAFGRDTPARLAQRADLPNDYLDEDFGNLGLILNRIRQNSALKRKFISALQEFYEDAEDIDILVEAGTVQVFLHERSFSTPIPATRLSDGTLRWIALLAIMLHPSPPTLVCIEEPEVGLHPDMMPVLARLLKEASERMQLIVTTYSDLLVDALSDTPESIVVCEKENGATTMRRLDAEQLSDWLKKYTLGQLWRSGEIGGNRW